jgi:hypothetical protein
LVLASGGLHVYNAKRDSSNDYARNRHYEVGIGGYATIKHTWISAAVGAGQGRGYRYGHFRPFDAFNFGPAVVSGGVSGNSRHVPIPELLGYYNTRFAQFTAWWPNTRHPTKEWGTSLRVSQVNFTDLTLNGIAQPLPSQYYVQTTVVMQKPISPRFKWQAAASFDFAPKEVADENALPVKALRLRVGLVFCPVKVPATTSPTR